MKKEYIVYKYRLLNLPVEIIELPKDIEFLHVWEQDKFINLWAKVEINSEVVSREIYMVMAGGYVPDNVKFLGTVLMSYHDLVVHVFIKDY